MLNAQLVTSRLKQGFYHLKSVDCGISDVWKNFALVANEKMSRLILLLVRLVFRHQLYGVANWYISAEMSQMQC